jgi:eukaryotic-like serine/threonine-protein kinase
LDPAVHDDLVGQVLLHYQVTERLGAGGMGVVYRATDLKLRRTVALKFLSTSLSVSDEARQRFMREAMSASALDHSNIGAVHAIEETPDGRTFLVLACYNGPTLTQRLAQGPMSSRDAVEAGLQLLSGLAEAHKHGIVHRDIKPGNLIFNASGVLKILDFGLARIHGSPELTAPGSTLGTVAYMSPEQAMGETADSRSDIWSAGVVLYEMLTGKRLFSGSDLRSVMYAVLSSEVQPVPGLPAPIERVLHRALEKDPAKRYQSAGEMIADLEAARRLVFTLGTDVETVARLDPQAAPVSALPATAVSAPAGRRRGAVLYSSLAVVLLLIGGAALAILHLRRTAATSHGTRVAVLPLTVITGAPADSNAVQGLAEGLRSQLVHSLADLEPANAGLLVVPPGQLAAQHVSDASSAREALGVDLALTGSLEKSGEQLHVVLSSVDTATARVIKSASVSGVTGNLPALEADLTKTSGSLLGLKNVAQPESADSLAGLPPSQVQAWLTSVGYLQQWDKPGNLDAAIQGLQTLAAAVPSFAPGYATLAECYIRRFQLTRDAGALQAADENATHAATLAPALPQVLVAIGQVRVLQGRYSDAVSAFQRALTAAPRRDAALAGLAQAYAAMGLPDKAVDAWKQAIALHPRSVDPWNQLGRFELQRGEYKDAAEDFREAASFAPGNAALLSNLGAALMYAGSADASRRALQESIRIAPSYPAWTNLGNLDLSQDRFSDAAADYEKALEFNKSDYRIWSNMGVAYSRTPGEHDKARDAFLHAAQMCREALRTNPNDPVVLSDLAMFLASEGDERQEPLTLIEKALALAPEDTYVQFNAAETYESLGFRKEALDWVHKLVGAGYPLDDIEHSPVLSDLVRDSQFQAMVGAQSRSAKPEAP